MTNKFIPSPGFPFSRLPQEIRLQILQYTHLRTPGDYMPLHDKFRIEKNTLVTFPSETTGCRKYISSCCIRCTESSTDCCCLFSNASYSATCDCRVVPFDLFLTSKEMRADAHRVFYSTVRFEFDQDPDEILLFLRGLPTGASQLLTYIGFHFSYPQIGEWQGNDWRMRWRKLMQLLKTNLNVAKITIAIHIEVDTNDMMVIDRSVGGNNYIHDGYAEIARGLKALGPLDNVQFTIRSWLSDLAPFLRRDVLGQSRCDVPVVQKERHPFYAIPPRYDVDAGVGDYEEDIGATTT